MRIILLSRSGKSLTASGNSLLLLAGVMLLLMTGAITLWAGYQMGLRNAPISEDPTAATLRNIFESERRNLADAKASAQEHIDALAMRVGQLQAHVLRLDALGERLTQIGNLDKGEFSFEQTPPMGGPVATEPENLPLTITAVISDIDALGQKIDDREQQLTLLEDLMINRSLLEETFPAGRPIKGGWTSSYFGMRNDPFTGKRAMHKGMDFAGKRGSSVIAVAGGVVTWADKRYGYGKMVEIHHGGGYVTRYGHNQKILVKEGERVAQGQVIATMGSSGRSTGPHVHFEVLRNGRQVNPLKYIKSQRKPTNS